MNNGTQTLHWFVVQHGLPVTGDFALHVLHLIDEYLAPVLNHEVITAACKEGVSEHTLEILLRRATPKWRDAVTAAVEGGHLHVLRWMTEQLGVRGPWKADIDTVITTAAAHGHLDVVKWLYERGIDYDELCDIDMSAPGSIEKTWLYRHCLAYALAMAAKYEHLEVVQWIYNIRKSSTCSDPSLQLNIFQTLGTPIDIAIKNGHVTMAQWLREVSADSCSTEAVNEAARNGHLEMLQWLQSTNLLTCTEAAMDGAAENGHLETVKWLHEFHTGCSSEALSLAAGNGHLDVVEWIYANIPMIFDVQGSTWINATAQGHLNALQWLHNHFPRTVSAGAMDAAAKNGHLEVVMWLHEHLNESWTHEAPFFPEIYMQSFPQLELIRWLHTHYPNKFVTGIVDPAAERGHLDIVRWLHENNIGEFTTHAMDGAAEYRHLDVVLYLLEHRSEGFSSNAMTSPGDFEVQCLFSTSDNVHSKTYLNPVSSAQMKMVQSVFKTRPSFVQGCLRCLAEIAVRTSNVRMLDWVNQFGLELRSTAPIRYAVSHNYMSLLQWFHRNGFMMNEPDLLELAVKHESLDAARWLWAHGYEINSLKFAENAGKTMVVPLLRWLLDNGPPLNIPLALEFAICNDCVEVMTWVSESDRVLIVLWALQVNEEVRQNDVREILLWILTRTSFDDESSRRNIHDRIQQLDPSKRLLWLQKNLANYRACSWCFTTPEIVVCRPTKIRRRV